MSKIVIVYGSTMGTTEGIADVVGGKLTDEGHDVTVKNVSDMSPSDLLEYEVIILGCSTWGDGELQDDFIDFEEKMHSVDFSGKKAAVFGPGESCYGEFCASVDILCATLKERGADLIVDGLKIDMLGDDADDAASNWVSGLLNKI